MFHSFQEFAHSIESVARSNSQKERHSIEWCQHPPMWGCGHPPMWECDHPPMWGRGHPPMWGRGQHPPMWGRGRQRQCLTLCCPPPGERGRGRGPRQDPPLDQLHLAALRPLNLRGNLPQLIGVVAFLCVDKAEESCDVFVAIRVVRFLRGGKVEGGGGRVEGGGSERDRDRARRPEMQQQQSLATTNPQQQ